MPRNADGARSSRFRKAAYLFHTRAQLAVVEAVSPAHWVGKPTAQPEDFRVGERAAAVRRGAGVKVGVKELERISRIQPVRRSGQSVELVRSVGMVSGGIGGFLPLITQRSVVRIHPPQPTSFFSCKKTSRGHVAAVLPHRRLTSGL